ncbi:serine palmitoyltransferase 1-like isoform X2 [Dysidea avara]|uniref:serine palmitoyltransferase 1-like isoform X2 n=1 Tax=Dysidea avara TaxID=196820 RepID=UPI003319A946
MADHSPAGGEALTLAETFNVYFLQVPTYHLIVEVLLVVYILRLLLSKTSDKPKEVKLTKEEEDELIAEWQPEPLIPKGYPGDHSVDDAPIVTGAPGTDIVVNGKKCLNLGTFNFLGFAGNQSVKDAAAKSVRKYGVGSCGPRGFYGTIDIHLDFEKKLAEFLHYEEAVLYSFGYATTSSAIPAYSTRNDTIFCDEGVCFAIQRGIEASRSKVKYFRHNDMDHLESLLEEKLQQEKKNPAKAKKTRKVIVVEGLYLNYGDLAPLPKLVELKKKYSTPLIIDESFSFGVLGGTGRGALEHFGLSSNDVDLNCISAEVSLASIGGLSCGKSHIVDRQRLSGQGYCFSASLPPLQAAAAIEALSIMDKSPEMFNQLRNNARRLRELLKGIKGIKVCGESFSPLIHLQLSDTMGSREQDDDVLQQIVDKCYENGVIMVRSKYLENEYCMPPPSIRVTVMHEHIDDDLIRAADVIKKAVKERLK